MLGRYSIRMGRARWASSSRFAGKGEARGWTLNSIHSRPEKQPVAVVKGTMEVKARALTRVDCV